MSTDVLRKAIMMYMYYCRYSCMLQTNIGVSSLIDVYTYKHNNYLRMHTVHAQKRGKKMQDTLHRGTGI